MEHIASLNIANGKTSFRTHTEQILDYLDSLIYQASNNRSEFVRCLNAYQNSEVLTEDWVKCSPSSPEGEGLRWLIDEKFQQLNIIIAGQSNEIERLKTIFNYESSGNANP